MLVNTYVYSAAWTVPDGCRVEFLNRSSHYAEGGNGTALLTGVSGCQHLCLLDVRSVHNYRYSLVFLFNTWSDSIEDDIIANIIAFGCK